MKADRREASARLQTPPPPPEGVERRGPALVVQVRDVAVLVALLTGLDTVAKLVLRCG